MTAARRFVRQRRPRSDRGAFIPLLALCIVVLLVFVAFAVDLGRIYAERRQDQSSADSGALSGAFQMLLSSPKTDQAIFDEVVRITYKDLDPNTRPATPAAWQSSWPACVDTVGAASVDYGNGSIKPSAGTIGCIRRSSNGKKLRVKLPARKVSTFFAGIIGINSLTTTAVAEAGLNAVDTGVLPFAVSATGPAGSVICLKDPPNGLSVDAACPGSTGGNFGYLASPRPSFDSNQACNGGQNSTIQQNIAQGIDHNLQTWPAGSPNIPDVCTGLVVAGIPNYLSFQTGNISGTIEDGFITGAQESGTFDDGQPARLARSSPCVVAGGVNQSGVPNVLALQPQPSKLLEWCGIWSYLLPFSSLDVGTDPAQIPQECYDLKTIPAKQNLAGVKACFAAYAAGGHTVQLFSPKLRNADRFAWIPQSVEDLSNINGSTSFHIQQFRAVFIQTIYYQKNGNQYAAYNPGEALPPVANCPNCNNFSSVTALLFDSNMLPEEIQTPGSDDNNVTSIGLIK
jgi:hypothetical protein